MKLHNVIKLLLAILCIGSIDCIKAQQTVVTERFTINNGLSDNSALCALRDTYGFLWIGTENGLNYFDGLHVQAFRDIVTKDNPNETNTIMSLYENDGDIWFGGTTGLYVFCRKENSYKRFMQRTQYGVVISSPVSKIVSNGGGRIWILTQGQGIFIYNTHTKTLTQDSRHGSFFSDIIMGSNGLMYAVTLSGQLAVFREDGIFINNYDVEGYQYNKVPICIAQTNDNLWLAYNTSLQCLSKTEKPVCQQIKTPQIGVIHGITTNKQGQLLLGSDNGVYLYTPNDGHFRQIEWTEEDDTHLHTDKTVNALMWDVDSTLFVLTRTGGMSSVSFYQPSFAFIPLPEKGQGGHYLVRALCYDEEGELYIGTDRGLFKGNYNRKEITTIEPHKLSYDITSIMVDGDDIWLGTRHNGIRILNRRTKEITEYTYSSTKPYTIPSNEVNSIYRTSQGEIYILTSWGLSRYDSTKGVFYGYANINAMTPFLCMQETPNGWIWASTSNRGLFCKRSADSSFDSFQSETIGKQTVTVMHCDSQGEFWVAINGGGLYRYDVQKGDFARYDSQNSLLYGQNIGFIEEDEQGALWMGTSVGIVRINPSRDEGDIKVYGFTQTANFYHQNSSCAFGYNNILFGGDGGVYHFKTSEIRPSSYTHRVYIQNLTLPYSADSRSELKRLGLDVPLYTREHIELPFADNSFTIHFASARYSGMPVAKYEYMLQGFDHTWIRGISTPEVTYANLPPGDYEFILRHIGQTDEAQMARLRITILPPWYRTTYAYIIYILLLFAIVFYVYYCAQHYIRKHYQKQMQEFQQEKEKEMFRSKINFFIDLVHEIRTPLTLMSLPLEQLDDNKHTAAIRRNMDYLLGITNQLLDFQKQEDGNIMLACHPTDAGQMLNKVYEQFCDATEAKGKLFQLQLPEESVCLNIDTDKMMKVMMNLVGNALKYAKNEIIICMEHTTDDNICISVIDDGCGVPQEEQSRIFDRYHQIEHDSIAATLGTGLGLAYAKMLIEAHKGDLRYEDAPGGGACFTMILPKCAPELAEEHLENMQILTGEDHNSEASSILAENGFSILLVEDNEELLNAISDALRSSYKVIKARDGIEALDCLKYRTADVVVSDVMMPNMDGIELCRHLKQNMETSHIPVIMLTAKVAVQAKEEGLESGADIYMEKPFSIRQLHLQIENLLRLRQTFYERMRSIDGFHSPVVESEQDGYGLNSQDLQFIERLQKMLEENMRNEEFTINDLAEGLNMSRSSFYHKIKALTGMPPADYLKLARMNQAARLLSQGMRSSEVAERVGFTSSSYFAKCFRAQFGCLPKDYHSSSSPAQQ